MTDSSYQVKLEIFEGPLDLLLHLIKKQDMSVIDVNISEITQEYLSYVNLMKDLNLEMAGEFLVMAASLMQIKARMLLPQDPSQKDAAEEGPDPRAELVAKLLEYQKFKEVSKMLSQREFAAREVFYRNTLPVFADEDMQLEATLFDLLDAFKMVLKDAGEGVKELLYEQIPLEQKIREIMDLMEQKESLHFSEIFTPDKSRRELIVTFLALLELIRLKQVTARQSDHYGDIRMYRVKQQPDAEVSAGEPSGADPGEGAGQDPQSGPKSQ